MSEDTEAHLRAYASREQDKQWARHVEGEEHPFSRAAQDEADKAILRKAEAEQRERNKVLFQDGKGKLS
jgi:hypothetical protein